MFYQHSAPHSVLMSMTENACVGAQHSWNTSTCVCQIFPLLLFLLPSFNFFICARECGGHLFRIFGSLHTACSLSFHCLQRLYGCWLSHVWQIFVFFYALCSNLGKYTSAYRSYTSFWWSRAIFCFCKGSETMNWRSVECYLMQCFCMDI